MPRYERAFFICPEPLDGNPAPVDWNGKRVPGEEINVVMRVMF